MMSNGFPNQGMSFPIASFISSNDIRHGHNLKDTQGKKLRDHSSSFESGLGHLHTRAIIHKKYKSSKSWEILSDTTSFVCRDPQVMTDGATLTSIRNDIDEKQQERLGKKINQSNHPGEARNSDSNTDTVVVFEPWGADYDTSTRTQKSIKSAAKQRASPIVRASSVLKTLLNTDPTKCNASNLVCALTLSAKIVPKHAQRRHEFRELLHQALDVLYTLAEKDQLNTRQLANAIWAIAKHYSIDENIFPPSFRRNINNPICYAGTSRDGTSSSSTIVSFAEKWNLREEEGQYEKEERALCTVEMIARQLLDITTTANCSVSSDPSGTGSSIHSRRRGMNQVEISMVFWAYAILFPRHVPAGWELPPRVGLMDTTVPTKAATATASRGKPLDGSVLENDEETITFEKLEDSSNYNAIRENIQPTSIIVDKLFDALASDMIQPIEKDGMTKLHQCQWKELSTIAWSFANRGYCQSPSAQALMMNLSNVSISRILEKKDNDAEEILPRDVTEIAWALGTMQSDCYNLSDSLEQFVMAIDENLMDKSLERPMKKWKSADCVQMAIALGHGRLDQRGLLEQIYREALISMREVLKNAKEGISHPMDKPFLVFEIVALLWVQARLYLTGDCGIIFDEFSELAPKMILYRMHMLNDSQEKSSLDHIQTALAKINLGSQEQANLVWSLTVLEKYHSKFAVDLLSYIIGACSKSCKDGHLIRLEHAHQLWQSIVILQHECPEAVKDVDPQTLKFLKHTWNQEKARQKSSSARHRALSQTLNFMGVKHYNEHDEDVDMALVLKMDSKWTHSAEHSNSNTDNKQRVAVEFDGPSHFTKMAKSDIGQRPKPPRALGHTVLKYKLLKKQGWTIVRIPFYEFDRIPFWASMERQRYLQRKLKTHANLRFSGVDVSEYKAPVPNRNSRFD